jgi:integrase
VSGNWLEDSAVKKWFQLIATKQTVTNYTREFPKFLEFVKANTPYKTPSEIIALRLEQKRSTDQNQVRYWEDIGKRFAHDLNKTSYAYNTKKSFLRTMLSFFSIHHGAFEYSRGELFDILEHTEKDKVQKWIPSNEEIRVLYRMAHNSRDRAILLTLYQSGLSEIDVVSMKIEQFHFYDQTGKWQIPISEDYYLSWFREKSDTPVQTCISRETLEEIRIMLQQRAFPQEGSLFVSLKQQKPLDTRELHDIFKSLVEHAFNGKVKLWKTKNLRDAFMNALEKAKVPTEIKDVFVGHTRQGAKKSYAVAEDTIKTLYSDAFAHLTINGFGSTQRTVEELKHEFETTRVEDRKKLEELVSLVVDLRTENRDLKTQLGKVENKQDTQSKMIASMQKDIQDQGIDIIKIQKKVGIQSKSVKFEG